MVFSLGKLFLSDQEIIPFKPWPAKIGTNDINEEKKCVWVCNYCK